MPDDIYQVGAVTIRIGIDADGGDVTEIELDGDITCLTALGALAVAQRDLLEAVDVSTEDD